ncbi:uncharacterized protein METZ01_LOCUS126694, partial [marine metagenome]
MNLFLFLGSSVFKPESLNELNRSLTGFLEKLCRSPLCLLFLGENSLAEDRFPSCLSEFLVLSMVLADPLVLGDRLVLADRLVLGDRLVLADPLVLGDRLVLADPLVLGDR